MKKSFLRNFAIIASLVIVFVMTFAFACDVFDAHIFAPIDVTYAQDASTSASDDYYASVESLTTNGSSFRSSLASLITSTHHTETVYDNKGGSLSLKEVFKKSDADSNKSGNILWFYSGTSVSFSGFSGDGTTGTNREHVWPKNSGKAFDAESGPGSDAHHLRPTNTQLNSSRSSLQFGEVPQTVGNIVSENGKINYENLCYKSGNYFYPGEGYRGQTARILMYMQVRWGDDEENKYNLQFVLGSGGNKTIGDIATLMKWHLEEPVCAEEITRNNYVASIQGNRNPFIDHPEYAERIYCYDGQSYNSKLKEVVATYGTSYTEPITSLTLESSKTLAVGESTTLAPTYSPSNAVREVTWTSSDSSVATVDANGKVTAVKSGSATITVASKADANIKATTTVTVTSVSDIEIVGTPTKTEYVSGNTFDPQGLTVNAIFSNNTKRDVTSSCIWLDGTTSGTTLSAGTTSVICKYSTFTKTLSTPITVTKQKGETVEITRDSAGTGTGWGWLDWKTDSIDGKVFCFKDNKTTYQINNKNTNCEYLYLYNTTPINNLKSIKITVSGTARKFEILTSSTSYETIGSSGKYPTTGTSAGTQQATSDGTTWTFNTTDKYFTINYVDNGAVYIESIEITYGDDEQECTNHVYGDWTTTKEPTATEDGEKTRSCTICGHTETQKIDALGTSGGDGNQGGNNTGGNTGEDNTPDVTYTAQDFQNAVKAIESASTAEEKQEAITYAENIYSSLNFSDKTSSAVIEAYNSLDAQRKALDDMLADTDNGLSGGAIAGIVIGSVAFAAIVAFAVIYLIRYNNRKNSSRE